jgi:N4-gp56 family major capsid protein
MALYIADKLLERATRDTVFWDLCEKTAIPKGEGKTIQFTRYERLPLPEAPLEESVTPLANPISLSTVTATLDQWGAIASASDVVQLVIKHPLVQQARELLTLQHNELVDREIQVVAMGTTGVYFAGNVATRASLIAANVLRTDDVRRIVATLRSNGAPTYEQGSFKGIVDPFVEGDISKDPTFVNAGVYSQIVTLKDFEIGKWMGVRWMRSNFIPIISLMPAGIVTYAANTTLTGTLTGAVGFATSSHVKVKVTKLDQNTNFETQIDSEQDITSGTGAFSVAVTIATAAPTGYYRIYASMQGGASGTATLQCRFLHTQGNAAELPVQLIAAGVPGASNIFVVTGSGPVAPPTPPASINVHMSYVMGRGFIGATELDALRTFVTPAVASDSDPIAQRTKMSWKQLFKGMILNPSYGYRVESASDFS